MKPRLLAALLGALLLAVAAAPQAPAPAPERRVLAVSVVDAYGNPVPGLTAENFQAKYRGKAVKIVSAGLDSSPRDIAVVVDLAPSLEDRGGLSLAWAAAEDAVVNLTPSHRVALFTLERGLKRHVDFTHDRQALLDALEQAKARPAERVGTLLVYAVEKVAELFPAESWGGVLYLISDSASNVPGFSPRQAEEALGRAEVRVFAVWVNELQLRWLDPQRGTRPLASFDQAENLCRRLARVSGGLSIQLPPKQLKPEQVPGSMGSLYRPIVTVYRLEVTFPEAVRKAGNWELEVVGDNGTTRKDMVLAYPRLLVPLTEPAARK